MRAGVAPCNLSCGHFPTIVSMIFRLWNVKGESQDRIDVVLDPIGVPETEASGINLFATTLQV